MLATEARRGQIVAVANRKGGVGKTTTVVNLATALAATGLKILVVDLDPQGNATTSFGINRRDRTTGTYDLLIQRARAADAIVGTGIPNLDIIVGSEDLTGAEVELVDQPERERVLAEALRSVAGGYDYVLVDCPPSLGLLSLNGLVAADAVLLALQCEFLALEGLSQVLNVVEMVRKSMNPGLTISGVLLTMFDKRSNLANAVASDVRGHLGDAVFETMIPRSIRVAEAPSHGKPVLLYDFRSPGAQAYVALAGEFLRRDRTAKPRK